MSLSATLDPQTTNAIREAIGAASRGAVAEACQIAERAIAGGGDIVALNAMLGMLRCQLGDLEGGVANLQLAHDARKSDRKIATNLAMALSQLGRHQEALTALPATTGQTPEEIEIERHRGFLALSTEDFALAVKAYERVVAAQPADWESWNNLGNARRSAEDFDGAIEALKKSTEIAPDVAPSRLNLCTALIASGDWDAAVEQLRAMASDFPDDSKPWAELHALFKNMGRDDEALEAIESAIARAPTDVSLLLGRASHHSHMLDNEAAEATYRQVLEIDRGNALAHLGLATCYDLTNRTGELAAMVSQAEEREIGPNALNFIRAYDHRRAKRFAEGVEALSQVPEDLEHARRCHLMGQLLEGAGRYAESFDSYARMNELALESAPPDRLDKAAAYRKMVRDRTDKTTSEWVGRWRAETTPDSRRSPVFLVGFPRSGTTLLDTMLMGHPSIEVLEEEPTLNKAFELFASYDDIPMASDDHIQVARDAYFAFAATKTPLKEGCLLVDKNPLIMNAVPFIRRLFPDARIILAVRHPCDVVLSCYVTNFKLNDGMSSFVQLETAAQLYDLSFTYFHKVQALMPSPMHTVMYEKVVADRDHELRKLFDFLEMDWHDAVLDHQATAIARGRIKTASYAQVSEPIYNRSAGRWQNYREQLEPIFPILQPWIDKFGYSLEPIPKDEGGN